MIVANWMQRNPLTIVSDTLVSDAKQLISEKNLHALPVVDNGRLRGLVTRANLLRMGYFVLRTQSPDEFNFFVNRLRVRDIMVRNPATVQSDDTMEHCMHKGRELGVAQFPVMEGETVVGVISANEIFELAAHCVGAWEKRNGVTLAPLILGPGTLGRITDVRRDRRRQFASDLSGRAAAHGSRPRGEDDHSPFSRQRHGECCFGACGGGISDRRVE